MQAKLNPKNDAKISFPGFQRIGDFTATGSESSKAFTVDGDTDKEYKIYIRNGGNKYTVMNLNNDLTGIYGVQYLINTNGTITSGRTTSSQFSIGYDNNGVGFRTLLTPSGFIKTLLAEDIYYLSGTTIYATGISGWSYNSTSNITEMSFSSSSGNFDSGTRITVYARRSNV